MKQKLNVLFIEDSEDDALLIEKELLRYGYQIFSMRTDNEAGLRQLMPLYPWDIILADYTMPQFTGIRAIQIMHKEFPEIPCIMISGTTGEETAVEAMKAGASDFLLKTRLPRLGPVIERELAEAGLRREKKKIETKLSEEEAQVRSLLKSASDAIILTNEEGKIIEWNPSAETLMGFSREEVLGKNVWDVQFLSTLEENRSDEKYEELKSGTLKLLSSGVKSRDSQLYTNQIHHRSGKERYIQTRLFSIPTPHGFKIGSIIRDITEMVYAREVELRNIKNLEILSRTAMDFMSLKVDDDIYDYIVKKLPAMIPESMIFAGPYVELSKTIKLEHSSGVPSSIKAELQQMTGERTLLQIPVSQHEYEKFSHIKFEPLPEEWRQKYREWASKNIGKIPELLSKRKAFTIGLSDKNNFYGMVMILNYPDHEINKALIETFIGQASVALTRMNILSALQKSEQRLNSLFEQNNDIVFTLDHNICVTSINPIGIKLTIGEFKYGMPLSSLMEAESYDNLYNIFAEAIQNKQPFCSGEIELKTRNGGLLTFQVTLLITYESNMLFEIFGIARNITKNKMLQNQVLSKIIETEEREKKNFAEDLHDGLGSLLSTVNIYVSLLQKKNKPQEEKDHLLRELSKLVNEAVSTVRLFANSLTPNVLNDFGLLAAIRIFGEKINATRHSFIVFDLPDELPKMQKIIEINVYRILLELINNSMKHSEAKKITIMMKPENNQLEVTFKDNGKGFEVEKALGSETKGMGVKNVLARVKSINGYCNFESAPGKGVNVNMKIPLH